MRSLLVLYIVHAALRFPGDNLWAASLMSAVLLVCMILVARFAGWQSLAGGLAWLKSNSGLASLVVGGSAIVAIMSSTQSDPVRLNHVLAYAIEVFFLGLAFTATLRALWVTGTASIQSWLRK
jgi:hypothetical protein